MRPERGGTMHSSYDAHIRKPNAEKKRNKVSAKEPKILDFREQFLPDKQKGLTKRNL